MEKCPIGIFDSGYGGLTILQEIRRLLPEYDYLYLGDNARAPYGTRSFDLVYRFTLQAVKRLFEEGCRLVILACNTASAKALRTIQQHDLPTLAPDRRVLGVIRPTTEIIGSLTDSGHIGILATPGTVKSHSYRIETEKLWPEVSVTELGCPLWVPLIEANEAEGDGADYFVKKYINRILETDPEIDLLLLGCTHYPILYPKIREFTPDNIKIVQQGEIVARSLKDYLSRHPEIDARASKEGSLRFLTTENSEVFSTFASRLLKEEVSAETILLND